MNMLRIHMTQHACIERVNPCIVSLLCRANKTRKNQDNSASKGILDLNKAKLLITIIFVFYV